MRNECPLKSDFQLAQLTILSQYNCSLFTEFKFKKLISKFSVDILAFKRRNSDHVQVKQGKYFLSDRGKYLVNLPLWTLSRRERRSLSQTVSGHQDWDILL